MKAVERFKAKNYILILTGTICIIMMPLLVSCSGVTPGAPEAANDDIIFAPGGFIYRASLHQQGEPDWPPVKEVDITVEALSGTIDIRYRGSIESRAGETRNNIIFLFGRNAPDLLDPLQINYDTTGLPEGITLEKDRQMYGGIGGQDKKSSRVALKIEIESKVKPGEYPFSIHLNYEGMDIGMLPCTIKVIE